MIQMSLRILISIVFVLALVPSVAAQTDTPRSVFAFVPETVSARLQERLDLFVSAYRTEQWDNLYDLLREQSKRGTKEDFVRSRLENPSQPPDVLLDFIPTSVTYRDGFDEWEISGCSKWQNGGDLSASIKVSRQGGDWFFDSIGLELAVKPMDHGWSANIHDTVPCNGG